MGDPNSSAQFGIKIKALAVDCVAASGCIGILNNIAEEGSRVEDVIISNAQLSLGVALPGCTIIPPTLMGAPNSGPYRNITIQYPNCTTCGSAVGVMVCGADVGRVTRGLENITVVSVQYQRFLWHRYQGSRRIHHDYK